MSFQFVPNSVTLDDLERRNGQYIALFHWIWQICVPTTVSTCGGGEFMHVSIVFCSACTMLSYRKFTFAISSLDEFLVLYKLDAQASVTLDKSTIFIPQ